MGVSGVYIRDDRIISPIDILTSVSHYSTRGSADVNLILFRSYLNRKISVKI